MTLSYRIKFFFNKRITPVSKLKWDIRATVKGYRKLKMAYKYSIKPIDLQGEQHIHIYPMVQCNLDCHFCQNSFYTKKLPTYNKPANASDWAYWLNRMYNFHHIDINGGEPLLYPEIIELLNTLDNHNIVLFTNLPKKMIGRLGEVNTKKNNINLCVSYHPIADKRDISEFVDDFKKIPKGLHPDVHVIDIPEVSYKNIRAAFAKRGVYLSALDAIVPTPYNQIVNSKDEIVVDLKTVQCKSDMECIAPDLTVYPCTGLMLRKIGGKHISKHKFGNDFITCDHYGLCGPCLSQKDVAVIK